LYIPPFSLFVSHFLIYCLFSPYPLKTTDQKKAFATFFFTSPFLGRQATPFVAYRLMETQTKSIV